MRRLILIACALALMSSPVAAGPNAGGTLIVHYPAIIFCDDLTNYCGVNPLNDCLSAVTRLDNTGYPNDVWKMYAAFPANATPRLKGISFGVTYDQNVVVLASGSCAEFELPGSGWPGSGTGTSLVWTNTQTGFLTEAYWFVGYAYYGQAGLFTAGPNPDQGGGFFADDSVPSILDPIAGYGALGFNQDGTLVCPVAPPPMGACCAGTGECSVTMEEDCHGCAWLPGYSCDPNPCPAWAYGACCLPTGECVYVGCESECTYQGGYYLGTDIPCNPNPCDSPVREETWGSIKRQYR